MRNQLTQIFRQMKNTITEESKIFEEQKTAYDWAMAAGNALVASITTIEDANNFKEALKNIDHALTSEKEITSLMRAKIKELGFKWDKTENTFFVKSAEPADARSRAMNRYLMTKSLLSSWLYLYKASDNYAELAYKDFIRSLNRERSEPTEKMQLGIELEEAVNELVKGRFSRINRLDINKKIYENIREIADIVQGGVPQAVLYKDVRIGDMDFLLYGRLDYLKAGVIYDIKYSENYEVNKYFTDIQHPFYFELCPEAFKFEYLIWHKYHVYTETYYRPQDSSLITGTVTEFMDFLTDHNLLNIYLEKWKTL